MRRFARPGKPGERLEADPLICRYLRTRTWLSPDAFGQGDPQQSPSVAQYWCIKTMRSDGPDGALALPEECTDERICFEALTTKGGES